MQQTNIEPLRLALQQQAFSIDTIIPSLENTVIHYTVKTGTIQCLRYIVESAGTTLPFEIRNEKGYNILHSVVHGGKKEHVQLILDLAFTKNGTDAAKLEEFLNAKTKLGIYLRSSVVKYNLS